MSNYKSHIKTQHKGCEMAQHFVESGSDVHSLHDGSKDGANPRSKIQIKLADECLAKQIRVILIEQVDLDSFKTTKEKRVAIEVREGFWQTQLRTLSRYGGLNKKDERSITNKRLAKKVTREVPLQPAAASQPIQALPCTPISPLADAEDDKSSDPSIPCTAPPPRRSSRLQNQTK